ncbi:MAG: hypothetical protein AB9873_13315 [Syntrophobacteraceae bacterium]
MTLIMPGGQEPNSGDEESDEIARLVRDGVKPKTAKERLQLAAEKLSGNVPLGVDASGKGLRKSIASSAELIALVKFGVFGLLLVVFGALFLFVGLHRGQFNIDVFSIGGILLILGIWSLREARKAARNLRAISKA